MKMTQRMEKLFIFAKSKWLMEIGQSIDDKLSRELEVVVRERIRQLETGEVKTIPNEQVFAEIQNRYGF